MQNFTAVATDASSQFLKDWTLAYLVGGLAVVAIGLFAGWLIWRVRKDLLERVESRSREARAKYEQINEELNRLKQEVTEPQS